MCSDSEKHDRNGLKAWKPYSEAQQQYANYYCVEFRCKGFYALVKGFATALGMQSLLIDWGLHDSCEVASDSSAARGHVQRRGLGKARHIQTRYLWIQERVGEGHVKIVSVPVKIGDSEILTKAISGAGISMSLIGFGFETRDYSRRRRKRRSCENEKTTQPPRSDD